MPLKEIKAGSITQRKRNPRQKNGVHFRKVKQMDYECHHTFLSVDMALMLE